MATLTPPVWKLYGSLSLLQFIMHVPPANAVFVFTAPVVGFVPSMLPDPLSGSDQPNPSLEGTGLDVSRPSKKWFPRPASSIIITVFDVPSVIERIGVSLPFSSAPGRSAVPLGFVRLWAC